jgi:hypothetical protein
MGASLPQAEGNLVMKPAEIVTAVISFPVVAAFIVSAIAAPAARPVPAAIAIEAPAEVAHNVADEIVITAKRAIVEQQS